MPLVLTTCCLMLLAACAGAVCAEQEDLVSDLSDRVWPVRQGWGYMGVDEAWTPYGQAGAPLRIGARRYGKGLGACAPGEILVELDGRYAEFLADVGLQDDGPAGAVFRVVADGQEVLSAEVPPGAPQPRAIRVPVAGVRRLLLTAERAGGAGGYASVTWGSARLVRARPGPPPSGGPGVDVAPFARVVTCDPRRRDGIRSNRFEEVPAGDVRLETDLPLKRRAYTVPPGPGGEAAFGLVWTSHRRLRRLEVEFADSRHVPPVERVRLECWKRTARWPEESAWQGAWMPWPASPERHGSTLVWPDLPANPNGAVGTLKVRWVVSGCADPVRVRSLRAYTKSEWAAADLVLQADGAAPGRSAITVYNGEVAGPPEGDPHHRQWDTASPLALRVRYSAPDFWRGDRTVLRFATPRGGFGVAVDDVLARGAVNVRDFGIRVSLRGAAPVAPQPLPGLPAGRTVLEEVRCRPDQTAAQALARTREVIRDRDLGPTLLSLPCENHKYLVRRDGTVQAAGPSTAFPPAYALTVTPRLGVGPDGTFTRSLEGGWLPIVVNTADKGGVRCRQRTFVAPFGSDGASPSTPWLGARPLCVVELAADNTGVQPAPALLSLTFAAPAGTAAPTLRRTPTCATVESGGQLVGWVAAPSDGPLSVTVDGAAVRLAGTLPAGGSAGCCLYLPGWQAAESDVAGVPGPHALRQATADYWSRVMQGAAHVHVPDELVQNVLMASRAHCLMASRSEEGGEQVAAWIGATDYPAFDSEAHAIIEGMDLLGHGDYARRCLDYFVARYNPAGYLTHGYTLLGTGWHLWVLGRHWELTNDAAWMRRVAPGVARACAWIGAQRRKTMKRTAGGAPVPEYGLLPPGVSADWGAYGYGFCLNGYYCAGLASASKALEAIGQPGAAAFIADAADLRRDILRAYRVTRAQAPVVPLRSGAWVPGYPMQAGLAGPITDYYPDDNMFLTALYDVEIGAHHLVHQGILDPCSREAGWILDAMEDSQFLQPPPLDPTNRPRQALERDWYDLGGYASMQPAYCHNMEVYAARDDVKPFLRSYFNAMAATLNVENLAFTENTYSYTSANKTHTTGEFLRRSRVMLLAERGDELWLAPCVTPNWLKDGMVVELRGAPTAFGPVSYRIESHVRQGYIEAVVEAPSRRAPKAIVLRIRHPDGLPIWRVALSGQGRARRDVKAECVRVAGTAGTFRLRVEYH